MLDNAPFEKHYRIGELARMWGLGRETIRKLVKDEPGVVKVRLGRKKAHTIRCSVWSYSAGNTGQCALGDRGKNGRCGNLESVRY